MMVTKDRSVARAHVPVIAALALAAGLSGALALVAPGQAFAEKKRVGIPSFAGPQEALIRKAVMQSVKANGYEMIKSRQIESTASSIGASLDSADGFRSLAKELGISAFVTGEVGKKKAKLTVRNGGDGNVNAEESWSAPNPRKLAADIAKTFWKRLGSAIERGKAPAGAKKASKVVADEAPEDKEDAPEAGAGGDEPTPAAATEDKPARASKPAADDSASKPKRTAKADDGEPAKAGEGAEASDTKAAESGDWDASAHNMQPRALDAWVGGRGFFRNLAFNQIASGTQLKDYRPVILGDAGLVVDWYPGAHVSNGLLSNVGVEVNVEQSFGITSSTKGGGNFATDVHEYAGALRLRLPLGPVELGLIGGYGQHAFTLSGAGRESLMLPDTVYTFGRFGAALRIPFGRFSFAMGGAWRQILGVGQIKSYFPHMAVGGVDANVSVSYRFTPLIEARIGGDLRRYFYDMHSRAGDANIAGGAVDQTIAFMGGVVFIIDGVPKGHDAPAAEKSDEAGGGDDEGKAMPKRRKKAKVVEDSDSDGDKSSEE